MFFAHWFARSLSAALTSPVQVGGQPRIATNDIFSVSDLLESDRPAWSYCDENSELRLLRYFMNTIFVIELKEELEYSNYWKNYSLKRGRHMHTFCQFSSGTPYIFLLKPIWGGGHMTPPSKSTRWEGPLKFWYQLALGYKLIKIGLDPKKKLLTS